MAAMPNAQSVKRKYNDSDDRSNKKRSQKCEFSSSESSSEEEECKGKEKRNSPEKTHHKHRSEKPSENKEKLSKNGKNREETKKKKRDSSSESAVDSDSEPARKRRSRSRDGKENREDSDKQRDRMKFGNRYWGGENSEPPLRRNSDRYWNKYSRDQHVIGSRYYDSSSKGRDAPRLDEGSRSRRDRSDSRRGERNEGRGNNKQEEKENTNKHIPTKESEKKDGIDPVIPPKKKFDPISSKTGGAYIPPAKLKMMQASITDKSSIEYQRIAWEALKKSIHGLINKVNTSNIALIIKQLFKENIVRGRGLLCRSIIQAQALSPTFTHVYAALVALINSRFPNIGELLLRRLVLQFRRGFKRNDKAICISATTFVGHLVNQRVAHEIIALEILMLLVTSPTDDSVEVAIAFLKECGMKLTEVSSKGIDAIFEMLRNILHEGKLDKRVHYMIEVIIQIRKDKFKDHEAVIASLDLVEEEDQFTHLIVLEDATHGEELLNVFKFDAEYIENEDKFKALSKEMLGDSDESGSGSEDGSGEEGSDDEDEDNEEDEDEEKKQVIIDNTETNLVSLRRTIYLTLFSCLDFEECAHKLMKMELKPGQESEICNMILDCCCEMRTYEKFFGLLAQRFCQINKLYIPPYQAMFRDSYDTVYRLKPNQLRNVAKFFAHLLFTDAISWEVLSCIQLNEDDTTSSGRIFIKILFQELSEYMGLKNLNERVKDVTLQGAFSGLFPRDNPRNTRFAINFFTSIGLGGLTDELREHLKAQVKTAVAASKVEQVSSESSESESSSSSSSSSESESESESESDSDSSDSSDSEDDKKKKKKKKSRESKTSKKKSSSSKKTSLGSTKIRPRLSKTQPSSDKTKLSAGKDESRSRKNRSSSTKSRSSSSKHQSSSGKTKSSSSKNRSSSNKSRSSSNKELNEERRRR